MLGGGRVSGYFLPPGNLWDRIAEALAALADPGRFEKKYGVADPLLFAMGDGNHSLATAKTVWEEIKHSSGGDIENHPARWALVEIVNLYDPGLVFHPIHRVLDGILPETLLGVFEKRGWKITESPDVEGPLSGRPGSHSAVVLLGGTRYVVELIDPVFDFPVESVDAVLTEYLEGEAGARIDYVHDAETVQEAGGKPDGAGFFLPDFPKESLFPAVVAKGALPRKSFSIGHSREKRYYLEARRIIENR
jgi:hypothetical protein